MDFKKVKLGQQESEYDFWKDKKHLDRLNMVEKLTRQFVIKTEKTKVYEIRKIRIK